MDCNICSDNDWFKKAGAYVKDGMPFTPYEFLLVPMTMASRAVVKYNATKLFSEQIENGLLIALCVRMADTAFFKFLAEEVNKNNEYQVCQNCIRKGAFNTKMRELRKLCNENIIHKLENGVQLSKPDLDCALEYYDEIFKLPLIEGAINLDGITIRLCDDCFKKNEKIRKQKMPED